MDLPNSNDGASHARSGIAYVWLAGALAVMASAPALFAREIFGDDWTVYYVYWTEGAAAIAHLMWQLAHSGYTIPMEMFVSLGESTPEVAARMRTPYFLRKATADYGKTLLTILGRALSERRPPAAA